MGKKDKTDDGSLSSKDKAELIAYLIKQRGLERGGGQGIRRREIGSESPLSFAQERLWFLDQIGVERATYNLPIGRHIYGPLSVAALRQGLWEIARRHEVLRTSFPVSDRVPVQAVASNPSVDVQIVNLESLSPEDQERVIQQLVSEAARHPFDLKCDPLLRTVLLQLGGDTHVLVLTFHHIVFDGWSYAVFMKEITSLYEAYSAGRPSSLAPLPIQYADFAVWQRQFLTGERLDSQTSYWKEQLGESITALDLPTDMPRFAGHSSRGAVESIDLSSELTDKVKALSQSEGVTLFMTFLAAFETLIYRYTGQEDLVVCSSIACRDRSQTQSLIGCFNNIVVMNTDFSGSPTFRDALRETRRVVSGATKYQDLPFQRLLDIPHVGRIPLTRAMFGLIYDPTKSLQLSGARVDFMDVHNGTADFELSLTVQIATDKLTVMLDYNAELFNRDSITQMLHNYHAILRQAVVDPGETISSIPLNMQRGPRQASVGGFLVNLDEVESTLRGNDQIRECGVLVNDLGEGISELVAVYESEELISTLSLRRFAAQRLPDHAVPGRYVQVEKVPLNRLRKIDYHALQDIERDYGPRRTGSAPPDTPMEKQIAEVWRDVLGVEDIGVHDNFFDLGGHSMAAMRVMTVIEEQLGVQVPFTEFMNQTLGQIAASCTARTDNGPG
jgi:acyl carrier protein